MVMRFPWFMVLRKLLGEKHMNDASSLLLLWSNWGFLVVIL